MAEWYDIAAGLPAASREAGNWFDRMYAVRKQGTAHQEEERQNLLKILTQEDRALRETLSNRAAKKSPVGGKGISIDTTPFEVESRAYQSEAGRYKPIGAAPVAPPLAAPAMGMDAAPSLPTPSAAPVDEESEIQKRLSGVGPSASRKALTELRAKIAGQLYGPTFADFIRRRDEVAMEPDIESERQNLEHQLRSEAYFKQYPDRTVPALAGQARRYKTEAEKEKERQAFERRKEGNKPAYAKITEEKRQIKDAKEQADELNKVLESLDEQTATEIDAANARKAQPAELTAITDMRDKRRKELLEQGAPISGAKAKTIQAKPGLADRKPGQGGAGPKPFDVTAQGIKTLDRLIADKKKAIDNARKQMNYEAAALAETEMNSLVDQARKLGVTYQEKQYTSVTATQEELATANNALKSAGKPPITLDELKRRKIARMERKGQ